MLAPFIARSKAVFGIEYTGSSNTVCAAANAANFDTDIEEPGSRRLAPSLPVGARPLASRKACPHPDPLPQAGEGERFALVPSPFGRGLG